MEHLIQPEQRILNVVFIKTETEKDQQFLQAHDAICNTEDIKSQLCQLSDQIKLLKKELTTVRRKKSKLLKEVEKITAVEEDLQRQLNNHTERQKALKERSAKVVSKKTKKSELVNDNVLEKITENVIPGDNIGTEAFDLIFTDGSAFGLDCGIGGMEGEMGLGSELLSITVDCIDNELKNCDIIETKPSVIENLSTNDDRPVRGKYICHKCQKHFKRLSILSRHIQSCSEFRNDKSPSNEKPRTEKSNKLQTTRTHNCSDCHKSFSTSYTLELHRRLHKKDFRQLCNICGKAFVDVTYLNKHMEYHIRRHKCDYCGKCFGRLRELTMHRRRHTGERPYMCSTCGKSYPTSSELRYHQAFHSKTKSHVCDICSKSFYHIQAFRDHYRIHTGETRFGCVQCEKRFTTKYLLLKHVSGEHTGSQFKCDECGKCFLTAGNLRGHQRSHTNDRPFHCDQCDKQYKNVYDLVIHKKRKHATVVTPQMC